MYFVQRYVNLVLKIKNHHFSCRIIVVKNHPYGVRMKRLSMSILAIASLSTYASELKVETHFSVERMNKFSCTISESIKKAYPGKSLTDFRHEIYEILRNDIEPWVDAYPIPAGFTLPKWAQRFTGLPGIPMARSEYYLQNAFILYGNPKRELKEPIANTFASYIHLARSRYISFLNGDSNRFSLRKEANLKEQIEAHLPTVDSYAYPYQDQDGKPIMQHKAGVKEKNLYKLAIGIPGHEKYDQFVYESQKFNEFSSPLFMWLLDQKDFSITPEKLFEKAQEIYGDPIVALGVIPWIFSGDALTVDRGTSSVVSYKVEQLVDGDDIPGFQYHFWGYLTQGIIGSGLRVGTLAYVYEKLYQKDIPDWKIDALSLKVGSKVRMAFMYPERCK